MTTHILNKLALLAFAVFLGIASTASASVPPMEVTVFDASGKVGFKGAMNANATFATGNLHPGNYVVQLKTRSAAVKDNQFLFVVSAGKKKVIAAGVPGETFIGGGAAMKVNVGPGLKITGQVAKEEARADGVAKYRLIDGKRYFWVIAETWEQSWRTLGGRGPGPSGKPNRRDVRRHPKEAGSRRRRQHDSFGIPSARAIHRLLAPDPRSVDSG